MWVILVIIEIMKSPRFRIQSEMSCLACFRTWGNEPLLEIAREWAVSMWDQEGG